MLENKLYEDKVIVKSNSIISGETEFQEDISDSTIPILKAFWEDDDIQEITVCSGNIGFVKTYRKKYLRRDSEAA